MTTTRKRGSKTEEGIVNYAKVPPNAEGLEKAILAACLLDRRAITLVADVLKPEAFYSDAHQRIYKAMLNMMARGAAIDTLTVMEELHKAKELDSVGGSAYLVTVQQGIISSAHLEEHAAIIKQKYELREIIKIGNRAISEAYEDSLSSSDLLEDISTNIYQLQAGTHKTDLEAAENLVPEEIIKICTRRESDKKGITGVPTKLSDLDKITGGWQDTDLIILAARPSVGKTALALKFAKEAALSGVPVAFFSLEMSRGQLIVRMLSELSEVNLGKIFKGTLTEEEYNKVYQVGGNKLSELKIFFDDTAGINPIELRAKVRRFIEKHGKGLVIIDYLQLMHGSNPDPRVTKNDEVGSISRDLKGIAKDMKVPIIALCQLSRAVEERKDGRPKLSDLRDSGAIEQDADIVAFLYHGDGARKLDIAKHRNGELDSIKLSADMSIQRFSDFVPFSQSHNKLSNKPVPLVGGGNFDDGLEAGLDKPF